MATVHPLLPWGSTDFHPALVWRETLDGRYLVEVERTGPYSGVLAVFDHDSCDTLVASVDVDLMYGAIFGPDAADVADWKKQAMDFVDSRGAP